LAFLSKRQRKGQGQEKGNGNVVLESQRLGSPGRDGAKFRGVQEGGRERPTVAAAREEERSRRKMKATKKKDEEEEERKDQKRRCFF